MKLHTRFPADLVMLLVAPIFLVTAIAVIADCAQSIFNWLLSHR